MHVTSVRYESFKKLYRLANRRALETHRYCSLGPGDDAIVPGRGAAYARCRNGQAQVLPAYLASDMISIGARRLALIIKEVETEEEIAGYHQLEECHYRGKAL